LFNSKLNGRKLEFKTRLNLASHLLTLFSCRREYRELPFKTLIIRAMFKQVNLILLMRKIHWQTNSYLVTAGFS